jgi:DNA topoisomerase-3
MLRFAQSLAQAKGLPCPPEVETRFAACRAFLDTHAEARGDRPGASRAPDRTPERTTEPTTEPARKTRTAPARSRSTRAPKGRKPGPAPRNAAGR